MEKDAAAILAFIKTSKLWHCLTLTDSYLYLVYKIG